MTNNNSKVIKLCALLLIVSVAVLVFVFKDTDKGPELSEARIGNQDSAQPATKQRPVDRPKDTPATQPEDEVIDLGLSTSEMFEALFKAIDAKDSYAAERLVKALRASKENDVIPLAKQHFVTTARERASSTYLAHRYQYYLLVVFADKDPEYAFENVRTDWGKDGLDPEKAKKWEVLDGRNIERLPAEVLNDEDKFGALSLINFIVLNLKKGYGEYEELLDWLVVSYMPVMGQNELPDPWLSKLIIMAETNSANFDRDGAKAFHQYLTWIAATERFSERLRSQANVVLQQPPNSFWELLDVLAEAQSVASVGKALAGLLATRALTFEEQRMFHEAFKSQFASEITAYETLMNTLFGEEPTGVLPANIKMFSNDIIANALAAGDGEEFDSYLDVILSTRNAWLFWAAPHPESKDIALFTDTSKIGTDEIFKLLKKAVELRKDNDTLHTLITLLWVTDKSLSEQVVDVIRATEFSKSSSLAYTSNTFDMHSDKLTASDGSNIVRLIDLVIEYDTDFSIMVSEGNSYLSAPSRRLMVLERIAMALSATVFPPLTQSLRAAITRLVKCCQKDIKASGGKGVIDRPAIYIFVDRYNLAIE